ncbi:MAG TPA: hypothetical protein VEA18_03165 [Candidatus Kapabacteria bacterium]|nr:hypothetical protein [Candidatus Kapabacteria bacterium]
MDDRSNRDARRESLVEGMGAGGISHEAWLERLPKQHNPVRKEDPAPPEEVSSGAEDGDVTPEGDPQEHGEIMHENQDAPMTEDDLRAAAKTRMDAIRARLQKEAPSEEASPAPVLEEEKVRTQQRSIMEVLKERFARKKEPVLEEVGDASQRSMSDALLQRFRRENEGEAIKNLQDTVDYKLAQRSLKANVQVTSVGKGNYKVTIIFPKGSRAGSTPYQFEGNTEEILASIEEEVFDRRK